MSAVPKRILFLCTGNSCRSQMAEGLLRQISPGKIVSLSAGARPAGYVHPLAIEVMQELGIDISSQVSKSIHDFTDPAQPKIDVVISVCDAAAQECPTLPGGGEHWHWPFDDPAHAQGTEDEKRQEFRRVRDEIAEKIRGVFGD